MDAQSDVKPKRVSDVPKAIVGMALLCGLAAALAYATGPVSTDWWRLVDYASKSGAPMFGTFLFWVIARKDRFRWLLTALAAIALSAVTVVTPWIHAYLRS